MYEILLQLLQTSLVMSAAGLGFCAVRRILDGRYRAAGKRITWLVIFAGFLFIFKPSLGGVYLYEASDLAVTPYVQAAVSGQELLVVSLSRFLAVVWLLGMIVSAVFRAVQHEEFRGSVRRLALDLYPGEGEVSDLWRRCLIQCGVRRQIPVRLVPGLSSPMVAGLRHPELLLPCVEADQEKMRFILLHEASHLKAGDLWAKAFCQLIGILHWFNPLCRLFGRLFEVDMESACDERVLEIMGQEHRKKYCAAILSVAREQMMVRTVFSTYFAAGPSELKRRLQMIMSGRKGRMFAGVAVFLLVFTICSGSALSLDILDGAAGTLRAPGQEEIYTTQFYYGGTLPESEAEAVNGTEARMKESETAAFPVWETIVEGSGR